MGEYGLTEEQAKNLDVATIDYIVDLLSDRKRELQDSLYSSRDTNASLAYAVGVDLCDGISGTLQNLKQTLVEFQDGTAKEPTA